jgi:hypothetical protein
MASKVPPNGSVPTVLVAGVAPSVPKGQKDPCRHRRNKKKKTVYVVYRAQEDTGSGPTGNYYVGRTRGATADQAKNNRERGHHRTDIGKLQIVCVTDTYSACRGAEQKHFNDTVNKGKAIKTPRSKGKGAQIAPISEDNPKKQDYMDCAEASAKPSPPGCAICAAP